MSRTEIREFISRTNELLQELSKKEELGADEMRAVNSRIEELFGITSRMMDTDLAKQSGINLQSIGDLDRLNSIMSGHLSNVKIKRRGIRTASASASVVERETAVRQSERTKDNLAEITTLLRKTASGGIHESYRSPTKERVKALEKEAATLLEWLPRNLYYHSPEHTLGELGVYRTAERLARMEHLSEHDTELVLIAALYHDTGFVVKYEKATDVPRGWTFARHDMERMGYPEEDIKVVESAIKATTSPQKPKSKLEKVLCDADLRNLGDKDFLKQNANLRREIEARQGRIDDKKWFRDSTSFLKGHKFWTESARREWNGQEENLGVLAMAALASEYGAGRK